MRNARIGDAPAIAGINIASWRSTYRGLIADATLDTMKPENYLEKWDTILTTLGEKGSFCLVAENDRDGIVGYALCGKNSHEKFGFDAELYAIYLLKEYQGKGIGKKLFIRSIEESKRRGFTSVLLFVLSSNTGSRKFYESFNPDFTADETITIDNGQYCDICYGWSDIAKITL
jgi:ribosomal protein S18 acetylase RimI-like enzyme